MKTGGQSSSATLTPVLLVFWVFLQFHAAALAGEPSEWLSGLEERETLSLVVTDSGLGGLSVVADLVAKAEASGVYRQLDIVFVNALFSDQGGYNALGSRDEQLEAFSDALAVMQSRYEPDGILVACNTLSVLVPDTDFVGRAITPVAGIVELGVEQIAESLARDESARNIMFATRTTVSEGAHRSRLVERGFADKQFIAQACPQLTQYIEQGFDAMDTELLIDAYVDEALSGMDGDGGPLTVSFNCTHFGYSLDAWKLAFSSRDVEVDAFLDPNTRMADMVLPADLKGRFDRANVTVRVVSMVPISPAVVDSIGRWLDGVSPATATALRDYERVDGLFDNPLETD